MNILIRKEKLNGKTFEKVLALKVTKNKRKFVASNLMSLAQTGLYHEHARSLVILNNDEPVGFMTLDWEEEERTVGLWRRMIDAKHQGKGYGKDALKVLIKQVKQEKKFDLMPLSLVSENIIAYELYQSFGFKKTGEIADLEEIMVLPLNESEQPEN